MKIITLSAGRGWHVQDLRRAAESLGHELIAVSWRDLIGPVAAEGCVARAGGVILDEADVVLLRTMPAGSLEQLVFRMDLMQRLAAAGVPVVNPPRAVEAAVDKYLALSKLYAAGIPVPATVACQRYDDAMAAFEHLDGDVVVKPLFGSEGVGITRVNDRAIAERVFATIERLGAVLYVQQFIDTACTSASGGGAGGGNTDLRLFVLGERVLTAMRRRNGHWKTNIAQGGSGEPFEPTGALRDLALRAARACDCGMAGIDIVHDASGQPFVLEVNAVPGWRALAGVTGIDVAAEVLKFAAARSRSSGGT